jgi:uncharacterized protein YndB with AHSA1/START domain
MTDLFAELQAVHRETGRRTVGSAEARTVVLRRRYDAPLADVWDAVTDPVRISRWFLPVSGDLRLGGTYQLEGNAGGEIVRCEPPKRFTVTWFMGEPKEGDVSQVDVQLSEVDGGTTLLLEHVATVPPEFWDQFGPGAVGVGWDLGLIGLGAHLRGEILGTPEEMEKSPEMRQAMTESSDLWGAAYTESGAPEEVVTSAVAATTAFYVPPLPPAGS